MKIQNQLELKRFFAKINLEKMVGSTPVYLLLQSNSIDWEQNLKTMLNVVKGNPERVCVIGLVVNSNLQSSKINTILLIVRVKELNDEFINHLRTYLAGGELTDGVDVLTFLKKKWQNDASSYALTFFWSTFLVSNTTHIFYRAISEAYQGKGMLKNVSLEMIKKLQEIYGSHHIISSNVIHPATFLFFRPQDKQLVSYESGKEMEITCGDLLEAHKSKEFKAIGDKPLLFCKTEQIKEQPGEQLQSKLTPNKK